MNRPLNHQSRRVAGQDHEAEQHGAEEGTGGHRGLPELPGQQQVRDEDQRNELDPGGEPGRDPHPPAAVLLPQVPDDQRHQDQVDLPEVHGPEHRLGEQSGGGAEQGAPGQDLAVPVAQRAHRAPRRREQRDNVHQLREPRQDRPRHEGHGREEERGERRVGELQRLVVERPVVERVGQLAVVGRADLPDDEAAVPVDAQVDRIQRVTERMPLRVPHPETDHGGERHDPGDQEEACFVYTPGGGGGAATLQHRTHRQPLPVLSGSRTGKPYRFLGVCVAGSPIIRCHQITGVSQGESGVEGREPGERLEHRLRAGRAEITFRK